MCDIKRNDEILHFSGDFYQSQKLLDSGSNSPDLGMKNDLNLPLMNSYFKTEENSPMSDYSVDAPLILPFSQNYYASLNDEKYSVTPRKSLSSNYSNYTPYEKSNGIEPPKPINQRPQHGIINNFPVEVGYVKFPEKLYKTQKRIRGKSEQRIQKSIVEFTLDFLDPVTLNLVLTRSIQIYVKRSREVKTSPKYIGPIQLQPKSMTLIDGSCKYLIKVDLDSVYEVNGKKVYQLQKTATEELNLFHLLVNISLADGRERTLKTREILLVGKKVTPEPPIPSSPESLFTPRKDSFESGGLHSPSGSSGYGTGNDEDVLRASAIVADHIKTKSLQIGDIIIGNTIQTPNGDIAYHFPLEDGDDFYKEGEVVGFHHDKVENKMKVSKLTADTASEASLKGVITRSQYLEAMKPKDPTVVTETVCMLGIIPVKVLGTVKANDPLYPSTFEPGVAVSGYHPDCKNINGDALIGYAFQSFEADSDYQVGFVQAGVSVLNTASNILLNKRIRRLESHWDKRILELTKSNTKFKRCLVSSSLIFCLLAVLLGIMLWQFLTPGSAYRYYRCKLGSISNSKASFWYNPGRYQFSWVKVHGIQFEFDKLMEKTSHVGFEKMKLKGPAKYYLNLDFCAYDGTRSTKDLITGKKEVAGPDIFATDSNCKRAYYYVAWEARWRQINSFKFISYSKSKIVAVNVTCTE